MLGLRLVSTGLFGLFLLFSVPAHAQTALVCERALTAAEEQYLDAAYDEALRLVATCLDQGNLPESKAVAAYRLLALIHLKQDALDSARSAIVNLLGVDPTYEADPVANPPAYVSLVAIVQRDLRRTQGAPATAEAETDESTRTPFFRRSGTWITVGGILVGSGVATALALGGGGSGGGDPPPTGPGSLPIPPGTP
jgi:hypothetical protein